MNLYFQHRRNQHRWILNLKKKNVNQTYNNNNFVKIAMTNQIQSRNWKYGSIPSNFRFLFKQPSFLSSENNSLLFCLAPLLYRRNNFLLFVLLFSPCPIFNTEANTKIYKHDGIFVIKIEEKKEKKEERIKIERDLRDQRFSKTRGK